LTAADCGNIEVEDMKRKLKELVREEAGQAFILALIMLLLGGLIMAPLLGFMSTGLIAGQANEQRMGELYAADAGIEDAILKIMNDQVPAEYDLVVNGKNVHVTVPPDGDDDPMITFFINLEVLEDKTGNYKKARPSQDWTLVFAPIVDEDEMCYEYRVTGFYYPLTGAGGSEKILSTGFWIHQYDQSSGTTMLLPWTYEEDGLLPIDLNFDGELTTGVDLNDDGTIDADESTIDENSIITQSLINPDYMNFEDEEPVGDGVTRIVDYQGRAFIWDWFPAPKGPEFTKGVCRTQRFALNPPVALDEFLHVAFLETSRNNIQISWSGEVKTDIEGILAEATSATGKSTTVLSYVFAQQTTPGGPVAITVLTWESDIQ